MLRRGLFGPLGELAVRITLESVGMVGESELPVVRSLGMDKSGDEDRCTCWSWEVLWGRCVLLLAKTRTSAFGHKDGRSGSGSRGESQFEQSAHWAFLGVD